VTYKYCGYLRHLRSKHGAVELPWTCDLCYVYDCDDAPCFRTVEGFMKHWVEKHPEVKEAKDVVHRFYGSHYTKLQFQRLTEYLHKGDTDSEEEQEVDVVSEGNENEETEYDPDATEFQRDSNVEYDPDAMDNQRDINVEYDPDEDEAFVDTLYPNVIMKQ